MDWFTHYNMATVMRTIYLIMFYELNHYSICTNIRVSWEKCMRPPAVSVPSFYCLHQKTDEGFSLQIHHTAPTYTTTLASLLDHDSPTAEGLSCDCTYQSDSWCVCTEKGRGLGISWRPTFSSKWLIRRVILSGLLDRWAGWLSSETLNGANLSHNSRLLWTTLFGFT